MFLGLLMSLSPPPATAQNAPNPTAPMPNGTPAAVPDTGPTLADALVKARVPHDGVVLAVNGDKVMRLPDAVLSDVPSTISEIAADYGRITQTFGGVTALAPPLMTVLNTDTTPVNPYDGIPPSDAFKLLCGSLDDSQWGLLTGPSGLGVGDLTDAQRPLFEALFADTEIDVKFVGQRWDVPWTRLGEDDLRRCRLRLAQTIHIAVPTSKTGRAEMSLDLPGGNGTLSHSMSMVAFSGPAPKTTLQGVTLRAIVPNTPKPSDLDFHDPVFAVSVSLEGVKTVADLVAHIAAATHREMYADRRYEGRTVTILGATTAIAGDLLRTLALCVRGAYRQVGTACVLTNDQVGLAPRRLAADRLAASAAAKRQDAEDAAADKLIRQRGGILGLTGVNGIGITAQEQDFSPPDHPKMIPHPEFPQVFVPWSLLTPPQQELAQREIDAVARFSRSSDRSANWVAEAKQGNLFQLSADVTLQLLAPGVSDPPDLPNSFTDGLFRPSPTLSQEWLAQTRAINARILKTPSAVSVADLTSKLATLPRRAVFARPRTAPELDAVLGAMKRLGLNQLWLDMFSQGKAHTDGSHDLLAEALAKAKGAGITVIPAIELLDWGPDAPADVRELNIFGETPPLPDGGLPASPALPVAQDELTALVQKIAATPGVSAIVIHDTISLEQKSDPNTVPAVVIGPRDSIFGSQQVVTGQDFWSHDLGYVTPLRLDFLRRRHIDPLDLPKVPDAALKVDVSVPEFSDPQAMHGMDQAWNDWRIAAKMDLMRRLLSAAQAGAGRRFPFLVRQPIDGYSGDGYGLWNDPHTWLPLLKPRQPQPGFIGTPPPGLELPPPPPPRPLAHLKLYEPKPSEIPTREAIAGEIRILDPGWDGLVLDCGDSPGGSALVALAPAPKPTPAKR